jgi:hypothetical protein
MSWQASKWASSQRVGDRTIKLLLMVIANFASPEGKCWHRQEVLARDAEMSDRTVRRGLVVLRELGLIKTEQMKRTVGGNGNLRIILLMPESAARPDTQMSAPSGHPDVRTARTLVSAPNEPSSEPSIETKKEPLAFARANPTGPSDDEIDKIFDEHFWPAYPKRGGIQNRPEAMKRFRKIVRSGKDAEKIVHAATNFADYWNPKVDRKPADAEFIPTAANWLKKRGWEDDVPEARGGETIFDIAQQLENRVRDIDLESSYRAAVAKYGEAQASFMSPTAAARWGKYANVDYDHDGNPITEPMTVEEMPAEWFESPVAAANAEADNASPF